MSSFILTRNLYAKDEVCLALQNALLRKQNLQECYFWALELHTSGFDVFATLWQIFVDFYYELNPSLEAYIQRKEPISSHDTRSHDNDDDDDDTCLSLDAQLSCLTLDEAKAEVTAIESALEAISKMQLEPHEDQDDKVIKDIASVVRNMFRAKPSPTVFLWRQIMHYQFDENIFYLPAAAKRTTWLSDYPLEYHSFLTSLQKQDWGAMCFYLKDLVVDQQLSIEITLYHFFRYNPKLQTINKKGWLTNPLLMSLLTIARCLSCDDELFQPQAFIAGNIVVPQLQDLHYNVDTNVAAFQLARWEVALEYLASEWERYVAKCPYWMTRIVELGGEVNEDNDGAIVFPHDEARSNFYAECELADLNMDVFNLGLYPEACLWKTWLFQMFPGYENKIAEFHLPFWRHEDFKFKNY